MRMLIRSWNVIRKWFQEIAVYHYYRQSRSIAINATGKLMSERGMTIVETIMVVIVSGMLLAVFLPTFLTSINEGTKPEKYATALYVAQEEIEKKRGAGYTNASNGTDSISVTIKGRTYTGSVVTENVEYSGDSKSFNTPASGLPIMYKRVTVTMTCNNIGNISLWTILPKDFYDTNAN